MVGFIITGSPDVKAASSGTGRLSDLTQGVCGHTGNIVSGSPTVLANNSQKARVGDQVNGCNIGTVVTGAANVQTCDAGLGGFTPIVFTEFQNRVLVHTEVDFGNKDDDEDSDDGLNIYPGIPTENGVLSREPTDEELIESAELDTSPTTTVEDSTGDAQITTTPPTTCTDVPDIPPDDFQLSSNYTLGDLSINTVLSKRRVIAQNGLTVQDIVCNLQAWAENIGESLSTEFGRDEMIITSGFRIGPGRSQHDKGQACDLQYPNLDNQGIYNIAIWIRDTIPFDQLILEYGGRNPWIHVSFNREGNRPIGTYNKFGTRISPGNYVWGTIKYMT
jgi:uncharacterized Zn-binding protein involved in type VI secretion